MDPFLLESLFGQFTGAGGPGLGMMDPALGSVMAQSPEAIIPQLASQGVMPPPMQGATPPSMSMAATPTPEPPRAPFAPFAGLPSIPWNPFQHPGAQGVINAPRGLGEAVTGLTGAATGAMFPPAPAGAYTGPRGDTGMEGIGAGENQPISGPVPLPAPRPSPQPAAEPGAAGAPLDIRSQAQQAGQAAAPATQQNQSNLLKALQGIKAPASPAVQNIRSPDVPRPTQLQGSSKDVISLLMQALAGGGGGNPLLLGQALGRR